MFMCRLSLAWGIPPTEIEQSVSASDFALMQRYFAHEPWGSWRDNAHAGLIASTVARAFGAKRELSFQDFMLMDSEAAAEREAQRRKAATQALIELLKAIAKPKVQ